MADTAARQEKVDHKLKERIGILITKKIIQKNLFYRGNCFLDRRS